jgi:hypothetical protein
MQLDEFKALVGRIEGHADYRRPEAFAVGIASFGISDLANSAVVGSPAKILDTWYPGGQLPGELPALPRCSAADHRLHAPAPGPTTSMLDQLEQALSAFRPLRQLMASATHNIDAHHRARTAIARASPRQASWPSPDCPSRGCSR